ncbi:MAG: hypothetical protein KKF30_09740, partial [Proteobacteria bacterium]|nr:hypothetical protein [Pseudomonadota bacterium]MBU4468823.1 hypothetical protein [Pseudomonadota bacterium]MCG2750816.1 hypothetical protein [Desulfobacteraceae bacterium]
MKLGSIRKTEAKNWPDGKAWIFTVLFISLCLLLPQAGFAAWSSNPIVVAGDSEDQRRPQVVYDGAGGYYVSWQENNGNGMFAQHYNAAGNATWNAPVQLSNTGDSYLQQESTADGSGGLLVAWGQDEGMSEYIRVQRVNVNGTIAWAAGGVRVINEGEPWIAADGTGGAIVMSYDGRLVNRVAADGSLPWGDAENAISFSSSSSATKIVSDGDGGAILLWREYSAFNGVAVQRIDSDGNFVWNSGNPLQISSDGGSYSCPRLIPQGGGAIVTWYEGNEILAQKIDGDGEIQWTADGEVIASGESPGLVGLASDGSGGAFIAWENAGASVHAQYIDTDGQVVWDDPVDMSTDTNLDDIPQHPAFIIPDGQGGFITTWSTDDEEIRAQRSNASGDLLWTATGALLATGTDIYYGPKLTSNGLGGAVMVWVDEEDDTGTNIMMQGVSASGVAGNPGYDEDEELRSSDGFCFVGSLGTFPATPLAGILWL